MEYAENPMNILLIHMEYLMDHPMESFEYPMGYPMEYLMESYNNP